MLKFGLQEISNLNINNAIVNSVIRVSPLENFVSTVKNVFITDGSSIIRNQTQELQFSSMLYISSEDLIVGISGLHSELSVLNYKTNEILLEHYRTNQNSGVFHLIYSPYSQSLITIGQGVKVFNFIINKVSSFKKSIKISPRSSFANYFDTSLICKPPFDENLQLLYLPSPKNNGIVAYDLDGKIVRTVTKMKLPSPFAFDFCPGTGKILASDEFSGSSLVLWDPGSSIEARFSFSALSSISINYIKFLNKENAVFMTSNGGIFILNVKTGQYIHCYTPTETPLRIFYLGNDEAIRKEFLKKINPKKFEQSNTQKIKGSDICGEYGLALCFKSKICFYRITIPWRLFSKNLLKPIFLDRRSKPNGAARVIVLASNSFIKIISPRTGKMLNVASPAASEHPSQILYDRVYHKPTDNKNTQNQLNSLQINELTSNEGKVDTQPKLKLKLDDAQLNSIFNQPNSESAQPNNSNQANNSNPINIINQSNNANQSNNENNNDENAKISLNKSNITEIFRRFSFSNNKINKVASIDAAFLNKKITKNESLPISNQTQLSPLFPKDIENTAEIIFVVLENGSLCIYNADNYPCQHLSTLTEFKIKFIEKVTTETYVIMNYRAELFLINFNDQFSSFNILKSFKFGGSGDELLSHLFSLDYNQLIIIFRKKIFLFDLNSFKLLHSTDKIVGSEIVGLHENYVFLGYKSGKIEILEFNNTSFERVMNNDSYEHSKKFHSDSICGFSFSTKYWLSASIDGLIIIWDYTSFLNVHRIELTLPIYSVAFLNGKCDIIVGTDNEIMIIDGKRAFNSENDEYYDPECEILDNYDKKTDFLEMQRQMERDKKKRLMRIERGEIETQKQEPEKDQMKKSKPRRFNSKKLWPEPIVNNENEIINEVELNESKKDEKIKTIGMEEMEKLLNGDQNNQQTPVIESKNIIQNETPNEIENDQKEQIQNETNDEENKEKKKSHTKKKKKVRKNSSKSISDEFDQNNSTDNIDQLNENEINDQLNENENNDQPNENEINDQLNSTENIDQFNEKENDDQLNENGNIDQLNSNENDDQFNENKNDNSIFPINDSTSISIEDDNSISKENSNLMPNENEDSNSISHGNDSTIKSNENNNSISKEDSITNENEDIDKPSNENSMSAEDENENSMSDEDENENSMPKKNENENYMPNEDDNEDNNSNIKRKKKSKSNIQHNSNTKDIIKDEHDVENSNEEKSFNSNENPSEKAVKPPKANKNQSSPQRFLHKQKKQAETNQISNEENENQKQISTESMNNESKSSNSNANEKNKKNKPEGRLAKLALAPKKTESNQNQAVSSNKSFKNKSPEIFERLYQNKKPRCSTPVPSKPTTPFQEMGIENTEDFLRGKINTNAHNVKLDSKFSNSRESKPTVITKIVINTKNKNESNKKPLIMNDNKVYQFSGGDTCIESNIGFQIHSFVSNQKLLLNENAFPDGNVKIHLDDGPSNSKSKLQVVRRSLDMKPSLINQSPRKIIVPKAKVNESYSHQRSPGLSKLHLVGS